MLTKVTEENLKDFMSGRVIVRIDGDKAFFYRFLVHLTECDAKYLVAQDMTTRLPERLYIPHITNEVAAFPFYFYDSYEDIYNYRINWHLGQIDKIKGYLAETREKKQQH